MKYSIKTLLLALCSMAGLHSAHSQTINIGPNQYAFQYTIDPDFGLYFNDTDSRYEFRNGSANSIFGFSALNGRMTTNLRFDAAADLLIDNNRYAFRAASNPNYGLFFNSSSSEYQFLNNSAAPIFAIDANTGEYSSDIVFQSGAGVRVKPNTFALRSAAADDAGLYFGGPEYEFRDLVGDVVLGLNTGTGDARVKGNLNLGSSGTETAGNLRWTGADFEGYDGSSWNSLTEGTPGPAGPAGLLPGGTTYAVPYYDGSEWETVLTGMVNNGSSVAINAPPSAVSKLYVNSSSGGTTPGGSAIEGFRNGLVSGAGTLSSWGSADAAVRGRVNWGNSYSAAVFGSSVLDFNHSASVVGYRNNALYGALAYKNGSGEMKAGYFQGDVEVNGGLEMTGSADIEGDVSVGTDLFVSGSAVLDNTLNVDGPTDLDGTLNVAQKITVQNSASDSIGIDLDGGGNYYQSDAWAFGESDGVGPALSGDFIMSRSGSQQYIFWGTYFSPVNDAAKSLGRISTRWNTIYASNGTVNTSDAREKKNIAELNYGLETLMKLKPVSYEWKEDHSNVGTKLGFVAQDLLEVVPEVVVTEEAVENRETGGVTYQEAERMGVFYDDLIPVLTKAIQEQQGTIEEVVTENEELRKENDELHADVEDLKSIMQRFEQDLQTCCFNSQSEVGENGNNTSQNEAELGQNIPNPFSESTVIRYYLPSNVANAIIRITDMEGSPVEDLQLGTQRGANQVDFQTQGLAAGTYLYSLFVDGRFVDTKKMVVAR